MAQTRRVHLRSLTGLRFYAAALVVLYHFSRYFEPMEVTAPLVGFGYTGVSFFFVLSGFVLAWSARPGDTKRQFYWHRFARVWPLHALTTGIAAVVAVIIGLPIVWSALPYVATLTQAWLLPGDYRYAFNGVSWSLACEAFFYLLFPFLLPTVRRFQRVLVMAGLVFAVTAIVGAGGIIVAPERALGYLFYTMPAFRLGEFIIGICLAVALQRNWRPRFTVRQALLVAGGLYVLLMAGTFLAVGSAENLPYVVANTVMLPGFVAVIAASAAADMDGRAGHFSSHRLVKLGQWSFALYLVHEMFIKLADRWIDPLPLEWALIGCLAIGSLCVAVSGLLYEWFERPIERGLRLKSTALQHPL
ncbi:acyltransferase [Pseudarthrobacter sp. L1SW]|uniref:acyltransferase family protein n=1 Tax=Pseudarthrobacter sp. L1SW TaxID=2851598 RepID=UPI001E41C009|nr:acyltransferase [Pseudarthrobacter sp. L1SW]UEL27777.1 acyltransferase [Pseudarthrobacter sp. L1SW]